MFHFFFPLKALFLSNFAREFYQKTAANKKPKTNKKLNLSL